MKTILKTKIKLNINNRFKQYGSWFTIVKNSPIWPETKIAKYAAYYAFHVSWDSKNKSTTIYSLNFKEVNFLFDDEKNEISFNNEYNKYQLIFNKSSYFKVKKYLIKDLKFLKKRFTQIK